MGLLITVDPGLRGCGLAVFDRSTRALVHAEYVKGSPSGRGPVAHSVMARAVEQAVFDYAGVNRFGAHIVVEYPQSYVAKFQKGDQNDLLEVAGVSSSVLTLLTVQCERAMSVLPREWKGTVDKAVMLRRIERRLVDEERASIKQAGALTHNILDAVGIGLWEFKRLNLARLYDERD